VPLYIDWKKSAYIKDNKKYDYWVDATVTNSANYYEDYSVSNSATYSYEEYRSTIDFYPSIKHINHQGTANQTIFTENNSASVGVGIGRAVSVKLERVSFIAPKSNITKAEFLIAPTYGMTMNKDRPFMKVQIKPAKGKRKAKYTKVYYAEYDINKRSPIVFRNFLSYSTSEKFEGEAYLDNTFYVSKILEMNRKHFLGKMIDYDRLIYTMPYKNPMHFYVNILRENAIGR
jgi:hypothetical protein